MSGTKQLINQFDSVVLGPANRDPTSNEIKDWEDTNLHRDWHRSVGVEPYNDFLMCVSASSKTGVSGSGKTTLATRLGKQTDLTEEGFDADHKASLSISEIAYQILPEVENRSAVIWDEAQGLVGTKGLDSRRGMREESLDAVKSILGNRDKSLTIIVVAQQFGFLDKRIYPLVDAWLLIREQPPEPLGTYHKVHAQDYNLSNPKIHTPAIEDFTWEEVPKDDEDYRALEAKKQMAKEKSGYARGQAETLADLPKKARDEEIERLYDDCGFDQHQLASAFKVNQSTISRILKS